MGNEQIEILQSVLGILPLQQWEQIQYLATNDRWKTVSADPLRFHCELCHMYMNFPFLY